MQWHSVGEFLAMGGYGFYVWGSVGACAVAVCVEPWLLRRQRQRLLRSLRQRRDPAAPSGGHVAVEGRR